MSRSLLTIWIRQNWPLCVECSPKYWDLLPTTRHILFKLENRTTRLCNACFNIIRGPNNANSDPGNTTSHGNPAKRPSLWIARNTSGTQRLAWTITESSFVSDSREENRAKSPPWQNLNRRLASSIQCTYGGPVSLVWQTRKTTCRCHEHSFAAVP